MKEQEICSMIRMHLVIFLLCSYHRVFSQEYQDRSLFEGFHVVLLGETTVHDIEEHFPNCEIEKTRYSERIVRIDSVGLEIHFQKEKFKNEYTAYRIIIKRNCTYKSKGGIGIGSTRAEISEIYPSILTNHSSRLTRSNNDCIKQTSFSIYKNSVHIKFISDGWVESEGFVTSRIELHYLVHTEPMNRPTLAFMSLANIEISSDFKSFGLYGGYGFYTTYFITGTIGVEYRISSGINLLGPKGSVGWFWPGIPGIQFKFSTYVPLNSGMYDIILNPQIGANLIGIMYLEAGYNFNISKNFNVPNSVNLTFGINFPMNVEKFVNAM